MKKIIIPAAILAASVLFCGCSADRKIKRLAKEYLDSHSHAGEVEIVEWRAIEKDTLWLDPTNEWAEDMTNYELTPFYRVKVTIRGENAFGAKRIADEVVFVSEDRKFCGEAYEVAAYWKSEKNR